MKLIFHGGASEVGRSCVEMITGEDRYLFDAGVKFRHNGLDYPEEVFKVDKIDGLFLSHAHLDHSGGLPLYEHHNLLCPLFMTMQTRVLTRILLRDALKVARIRHYHTAYGKFDIRNVQRHAQIIRYRKRYKHRNIHFTMYNAGHIPGSAITVVETEGKKICYTGDYNLTKSALMLPADLDIGDVDYLITESTYGFRTLPDRDAITKDFLDQVEKTIKQGGSVLIPVFAVGRAQEVLMVLGRKKWNVPIIFDGLSKKITKAMLSARSTFIRDKEVLERMYNETVQLIGSPKRREHVAQEQGIFVTTSGMLEGGPAMTYLKNIYNNPKSAVLLTGFQAAGTNGREVLESHTVYIDHETRKVKCLVKHYEFSAHGDKDDLHTLIQATNPKKIFCMHGDDQDLKALAEWADKHTHADVHIPKNGDVFDL